MNEHAAPAAARASSCWCPISGSLAFFLLPFLIVLKISLSETAIAQPPYTPVLDLAAGWEGVKDVLRRPVVRELRGARRRPALSRVLRKEPADRRDLDRVCCS